MSSCEGRGYCLKQCGCDCYEDEVNDIHSEVCICGHKNHNTIVGGDSPCQIYCKDDCKYKCELVECNNYKMCGQKRPQHILDCHNDMCLDCALVFGKISFLNEKEDCPICFLNKDMIMISCGKHKVCLECWKNWAETGKIPTTCPLCRNPIWK